MSLKPDLFEGLRFDFTKPFNQNFALCHSFFMGNVEVPSQSGGAYKMAVGTYEFGANLVSQSGDMMIGRVMTDGRLTGRVKKDLLEDGRLSAKIQAQLSPESSGAGSQVMLDLDSRGSDWNGERERERERDVSFSFWKKRERGGEKEGRKRERKMTCFLLFFQQKPKPQNRPTNQQKKKNRPAQDRQQPVLRPQLLPVRHPAALRRRRAVLAALGPKVRRRLRGEARRRRARRHGPGRDDGPAVPGVHPQGLGQGQPGGGLSVELDGQGGGGVVW